MLTKKEIIEFLENNGIRHDDKIVVHASLRSVRKKLFAILHLTILKSR